MLRARAVGGGERWRSALAGFLAVAVMLGVSEILAAAIPGARSHVIAVGDSVIDRTPGWVEREAIERLGTSDKPFLIGSVLVVSGLLGALLGIVAARRFAAGAAGIALMAAVGTAASFEDPQTDGAAPPLAVGVLSALAGIATLWVLLAPASRGCRGRDRAGGRPGRGPSRGSRPLPSLRRRRRRRRRPRCPRRTAAGEQRAHRQDPPRDPHPRARDVGAPASTRRRRSRSRGCRRSTPRTPTSTGSTPPSPCRRSTRTAGRSR